MPIEDIKQLAVFIVILGGLQFLLINFVQSEPTTLNPDFTIQRVFVGDFEPSSMTFLGPDDLLVLDRDEGKVYRIENGIESGPLLDVNVATDGYRGLLGAAASIDNSGSTELFLYFTEARSDDGDDSGKNSIEPLGNRLYRYDLVDNKLINPKLLLDLPALPGPRHAGGVVAVGPDNNIYLTIGDLDGTFRYKQYETKSQNYQDGSTPDGRSGILVVDRNGKPAANQTLGNSFPLNLYYAYGIRNSFGIGFDPVTGKLWDSENGPGDSDEINLVEPGFNSGWQEVQGLSSMENGFDLTTLVDFGGKGNYREPELVWQNTVGPTSVAFLNSDKYGSNYQNDMFVGDVHNGRIYHFDLTQDRTHIMLNGPLASKLIKNPRMGGLDQIIFGEGFGGITDIKVGPDGYLYVVSIGLGEIFKIIPSL